MPDVIVALPKLACETGASIVPAPAPEPTWYCARADGTKHGPFATLFPDGSPEIRGSYKDGALDGAWERHHALGTIVEQGTYVAGQKHGTWTQTSSTGNALGSYEMKNGSGVEKRWYDDGPLYAERALKTGVPHGMTKLYAREGYVIDSARYVNGKLDGAHAFGTKNTMRFEETFSMGVLTGARKIWHQGLLLADESYDKRGRQDGPYTSWRSPKIVRTQGEFTAGKRTGAWIWNDRDGKKEREGSYVNNKRDGEWNEYSDDKLVFTGTYTAGKPDGTFIYYKKDGTELGRFTMTDGTGTWLTFHGNGKPSSKQRMYKGNEDGVYQELTTRGKVVVEGRYSGGVKHGAWKELTPDGVLVLEQMYKRGKLDGAVKKYVDGKLASEAHYVDGRVEGAYAEYRLGKPALTGQYAADVRTGTWTQYNADGQVVRTATYKDGVLDGPWRELVNGVVVEGQLSAGRRTGTWTTTDKAGAVRKLTYGTP